jgi:hypothetical protein
VDVSNTKPLVISLYIEFQMQQDQRWFYYECITEAGCAVETGQERLQNQWDDQRA